MAGSKSMFFSVVFLLLFAVALSAPAEQVQQAAEPVENQKEDLAASEKDDLKTAASYWGGHWGGHGLGYGGGYGHWGYPGYGYSSWGWPYYGGGYGYYGWPYGGFYGHHGYWW